MKASDFELVTTLIETRERCKRAIVKAVDQIAEGSYLDDDREDDIFSGYWCGISKHHDGSGAQIDLTGCRIGSRVVIATVGILEEQIKRIEERLEELGVDVDE